MGHPTLTTLTGVTHARVTTCQVVKGSTLDGMTTQQPDPQPTPDPQPVAVAVAGPVAVPDPAPQVDADKLDEAVERADITPDPDKR